MKLGVFTVLFAEKSFEEMLDTVKEAGLMPLKSEPAARYDG